MILIPIKIEDYPHKRIFYMIAKCGKIRRTVNTIMKCEGRLEVVKSELVGKEVIITLTCVKCGDDVIFRLNEGD